MSEKDNQLKGIHHVTCVSSDININIQFYRDILGLRLVKKTVNFDDPSSYHLYYGDQAGNPGTLITFFIWKDLHNGIDGSGFASRLSLAIPIDSLEFWKKRFHSFGVKMIKEGIIYNEGFLRFEDFDGLEIELVETSRLRLEKMNNSTTANYSFDNSIGIKGIYGVTIKEYSEFDRTSLLLKLLGLKKIKIKKNLIRYILPDYSFINISFSSKETFGNMGYGSIHHTAFRVNDEMEQNQILEMLNDNYISSSGVIDRKYFKSIYFKNQPNALFEIATDEPGMLVDEDIDSLGEKLQLPERYEESRNDIEDILPEIDL